jgi:MFS family permease
MQNVTAAWMMTSLSDAAIMVALIQTASALPSFLLALPAGALADLVDRRRVMLIAQSWMMLSCIALSVVTLSGAMSAMMLLVLTFSVGLGNAFQMPAQQATTSDVVPQTEVSRAVMLSGISFNMARAVGPVMAGLIVAWAGSVAVFVVNVVSFGIVVVLLLRWRSPSRGVSMPRERFFDGMVTGLRYFRHSPVIRRLELRSSLFVLSASALWALLPLIARSELSLNASGYGLLLGCLGFGSIVAAALMPWVRRRMGLDQMVTWSTMAFAAAGVVVALVPVLPLVCLLLVMAGMTWIMINATVNAVVHTSVANWVRARTLAIHLFCFQGSMAFGAILWGALATVAGTSVSMAVAGVGVMVGLAWTSRWPLRLGTDEDTTLAPPPVDGLADGPSPPNAGRVYVRVVYRVHSAHISAFNQMIARLGQSRLRNGAFQWRTRSFPSDKNLISEFYAFSSWEQWTRFRRRRVLLEERLDLEIQQMLESGSPLVFSMRVEDVRR